MGKVAEYFRNRDLAQRVPGASAAVRGSVAQRPWHEPNGGSLVDLAAFCCEEPEMVALLGKGVSCLVRPSDDGAGVVFEFRGRS